MLTRGGRGGGKLVEVSKSFQAIANILLVMSAASRLNRSLKRRRIQKSGGGQKKVGGTTVERVKRWTSKIIEHTLYPPNLPFIPIDHSSQVSIALGISTSPRGLGAV